MKLASDSTGAPCATFHLTMEVTRVMKNGKVVLPASVKLPGGAKVCVVFDSAQGDTEMSLEGEAHEWGRRRA